MAIIKVCQVTGWEMPRLKGDFGPTIWALALNNYRGSNREYYQIMCAPMKRRDDLTYEPATSASMWWSLGSLVYDGLSVDGGFGLQDSGLWYGLKVGFVETSTYEHDYRIKVKRCEKELISKGVLVERLISEKLKKSMQERI